MNDTHKNTLHQIRYVSEKVTILTRYKKAGATTRSGFVENDLVGSGAFGHDLLGHVARHGIVMVELHRE